MSPAPAATAARTAPARAGSAAPRRAPQALPPPRPRPPLRVVPQRHAPARAPFVLLVSAILGGGLVLVLLINTWLAQGSFTVKRLQDQQTSTRNQTQAIAQQIAAQSAPDALAVRAAELGMVPAPNPVFKTKDGTVLGVAQIAHAAVRPAPPPAPPAPTTSASASPTASGSPSAGTSPSVGSPAKPTDVAKPTAPAQGSRG